MSGSQVEVIKAALQEGASKLGTANEHAQRTGNQCSEMADHFKQIAQGVEMTLGGIKAAIQCSKSGIESSAGAVRALEDATAKFRRVGDASDEDFQLMVGDMGAYLTHARTAHSNMTKVEGALGAPEYVRNLESLGKMATGNVGVFTGQSERLLGLSGELGPLAQRYTEGLANRLG